MSFPDQVLEVKVELEKQKDERHALLALLTHTKLKDGVNSNDREAMWENLEKQEEAFWSSPKNRWVIQFITDVQECKRDVKYFHLSNEERKDLIQKIKRHTNELSKLFKKYELNEHLISNDGQFFGGFDAYDENGEVIWENGKKPKISITDTLEFFYEFAEIQLQESALGGNKTKRYKSNRFVRLLAMRNKKRYGRPLYNVVMLTAKMLYQTNYDESDISRLLNPTRQKD